MTYPVGDIIQVGYTTIDFGEDVTGNVANGCGSGFNHLLDRLNDLRGSSADVYLGVLPAGIVGTPGNSIGGCAPQPGRVAGVFLDSPSDIPHEIGHCLNRKHAPCSTGCTPPPADPDSDYPQYGSFRSDSIGVFGFDAASNKVFDPSVYSDFMAYHFPQWVSVYTYNGLRGSNFQSTGAPMPGAGGGSLHLHSGVDINLCFLGLTIARDRTVTRRPSFTYPATLFMSGCCGGQFSAEFLDKDRNTLSCSNLQPDCDHLGCTCWPKTIRNQVSFPKGSRWFLIWEGDKKIYEEEIPDPPVVTITGTEQKKEGVVVSWRGEAKDLWYLVHWYDARAEEWRGVAPRLQEGSLLIPARLFARRQSLRIRVLATSGLATGMAEAELTLEKGDPGCPDVILTGVDMSQNKPAAAPAVLHAAVVDSAGRELPNDRMTWYAADGSVIGRGSQVDLRPLGMGTHAVRAVSRAGAQPVAKTWLIERSLDGFVVHHAQPDPPRGSNGAGGGKDDPSSPAVPC